MIDDEGCPRVADYGLARILEPEDSMITRWQAPEVLVPDYFPDVPDGFTIKSDVYAFACLCIEVRSHILLLDRLC